MLHLTLPLGVKLDIALAWIAGLAQALPIDQREAAMVSIRQLISSLGETEITVNVPIDHVLCQTADSLRAMGKHEDVRVLEELVQTLKGQRQRVVTGGFQFNAQSLADLDGTLERVRKTIMAGR